MSLERAEARSPLAALYALAAVAILYLARPVLVPVALAILLTFVIAPLVAGLERRVKSRVLAIAVATTLVIGLFGGLAVLVGQQFVGFADDLPAYRETIARKGSQIKAGPGGLMGRAADTLLNLGDEIAGARAAHGPSPAPPDAPTTPDDDSAGTAPARPSAPAAPVALANSLLRPILEILAGAAIVVLLLVMMLMARENIRDRIIRLAGLQQISLTTQSLEDAGARVGKYLRAQLLVNAIYGVSIAVGLLLIGVPSAALCGLTAGVLRFIPVLGPWLGAVIPVALSLAVFDGWYHLAMVVALFAGLELINNIVLEPWLYGLRTGLSSLGVVLAIIFWTWIWGAVGLVLAVPMTVCLVAFARQIPQLGVLSIMLGDEPVLSDPMRYYQRLLVGDEQEAAAILAATPADRDAADVLDEIVIPSLAAARADLRRGLISAEQARRIGAAARDVALDYLADHPGPEPDGKVDFPSVVCLPASDELDEAAGAILAELLRRIGVSATVVSAGLLASEKIIAATGKGVGLIVISDVEPSSGVQTRRLRKTLERQWREIRIIVVNWAAPDTTAEASGAEAPPLSTSKRALAAATAVLTTKGSRELADKPPSRTKEAGRESRPLARNASEDGQDDRDDSADDGGIEGKPEQRARGPLPAQEPAQE